MSAVIAALAVKPLHQGNQVKIIATGSLTRSSDLPDVPTIVESGLPGFRAVTWYAIVAPAGTSADISAKISKDLADIVKSPEISASIRTKLQMEPIGSSNTEAGQLFVDDAKLWEKVIRDAQISLD